MTVREALDALEAALHRGLWIETLRADNPAICHVTAHAELPQAEMRDFLATLDLDISDVVSLSITGGVAEVVLCRKDDNGDRYVEICKDGEWVRPTDADRWRDYESRVATEERRIPFADLMVSA